MNSRLRPISARSSCRSNSPRSTMRPAVGAEPARAPSAAIRDGRLTVRRPRAEHDPPPRDPRRQRRDGLRRSSLRASAGTGCPRSRAPRSARRRAADPGRAQPRRHARVGRRVERHLDRDPASGSGAPPGHPGIASSRSHWFSDRVPRRAARATAATIRVYIQRRPWMS